MATITVTNLQGHTSGGDANKVKIASGQTLDVNGTLDVTGATVTGNLPAANLTGAMPALDGSALTSVTGASMVKLAHTTVAAGDAADYPFNFTSVFSSTYNMYYVAFTVASYELAAGNMLYFQFGTSGTYVTASNACRSASQFLHLNNTATAYGGQRYYSSGGIHQTNGSLTTTENGMFSGTAIIANPFDSYWPVNITTKCIMQYFSTEANSYGEEGYSREDNGDKASYTDFRMGIIAGSSSGSDITNTAARRNAYGHVTVYGLVK